MSDIPGRGVGTECDVREPRWEARPGPAPLSGVAAVHPPAGRAAAGHHRRHPHAKKEQRR
jgi:hypothetical protein